VTLFLAHIMKVLEDNAFRPVRIDANIFRRRMYR
jgi:hypothetical protein